MDERHRPTQVGPPMHRFGTRNRLQAADRLAKLRRQLRILQVERAAYRAPVTGWGHPLAG